MKKIYFIFSFLVGIFIFQSCGKEAVTADVSRTTFFVDLALEGEGLVLLKVNEPFSDPGAVATENGNPVEVDKNGSVDPNTPDFYNLVYSAKNSDGFSSQVTRTVIVYEPKPITGVYDGDRVGRDGGMVLISSIDENTFYISDLMAGHYEFDRGFGPDYAAPATIKVDGNTFTSDGGVCAFGPVKIKDASISEDQRSWKWTITLTDFDFSFDVTLNKITE